MAYGGKKYVKKTTKYTKKTGTKASSSSTMAKQLASLKRRVNAIQKVAVNRIMYSRNTSTSLATAGGLANYAAIPLTKFDLWTRTFGTDADDESNKQATIRKINVPWSLVTNEPDDRYYSIWCVSLKDEASELLNSDGTLAPLTQGTHYNSDSSNTLLNLKFFNVHYHRKFTMGVNPQVKVASGTAGATQNIPMTGRDTQRLGTINVRLPRGGLFVKNPAGDWKAGVYPKDPSRNYFILAFHSGDSTADLEYAALYTNELVGVDVST